MRSHVRAGVWRSFKIQELLQGCAFVGWHCGCALRATKLLVMFPHWAGAAPQLPNPGIGLLGFAAAWLIPLQEWIKEKIADDLDGVLRRSYQTRQKYVWSLLILSHRTNTCWNHCEDSATPRVLCRTVWKKVQNTLTLLKEKGYLVDQNNVNMKQYLHTQLTSAGFYVITTCNNYLVNYTDFKVAPLIALAFRSDTYWGISGLLYRLLMHHTWQT